MSSGKVKDFFNNYLKTLSADEKAIYEKRGYDVWNFSNNKGISDRLISLVLKGEKVATTGLLVDHNKVPAVGSLGVITDSQNNPRCIVEYTNIQIKPFMEVTFEFAQAEGEGFKDIEEWRSEHRKVFKEWIENAFADESQVLCANFKLAYPSLNQLQQF